MTLGSILTLGVNSLKTISDWLGWFSGLPSFGSIFTAVITSGCLALMQYIVDKALTVMGNIGSAMSGLSGATADSSLLARINFWFPVDTLATCIMLYVSIWSGVQVFRMWLRFSTLASEVVEKVPFVQ